jgi:hypothetical protein
LALCPFFQKIQLTRKLQSSIWSWRRGKGLAST